MSGSLKTLVPQAGSRTEYACIAFDGPGQGAAVIKEGLVFRPDREAVAKPVIDFAETPPKVDATRVASWASVWRLLALRAASRESFRGLPLYRRLASIPQSDTAHLSLTLLQIDKRFHG